MSNTQSSNHLEQGLKPRHVTMLSIAGVIGAGLFVGSGHAIAQAGPAVLLAYAAAGTLVVLVMRMLAEMAVASPDTGSFSTYADRAIGHWAGFTIGWLYWWFWVLVIPLEANAAATILHAWFPDTAIWVFTLVITLLLTATNLFSVKNYGEFEFWFALVKVLAIIGFIILGVLAVFGLLPNSQVSGVSHLVDTVGFMPNGMGAVLAAMLTTMFSFMGTEIVTIAAAESKDPSKQITKATNSVIWRIGLFYLVSIFLVVALVPWNDAGLAQVGSYQTVLDRMGIPNAKLIVDIVVLIAVSQLRMRQKRTAEGEKIAFKMWLFPGLTWAVIVFIVAILTVMLFQEAHQVEIIATGLLSIFVVTAGLLVARRRRIEKMGAPVLN